MFADGIAEIYDAAFAGRDHAGECRRLAEVVRARRPSASSVLDVGCGTGVQLAHLAEWFGRAEGIDSSPGMLAVARRRLADRPIRLHEADMTTFDLGRRFDAVVCLFGTIAYIRTRAALRAAAARIAAHLEPGGVAVVEPFPAPEHFRTGARTTFEAREGDLAVTTWIVNVNNGDEGVMRLHHRCVRDGEVTVLRDEHHVGLFTDAEYRAAFESAGLTATRAAGIERRPDFWIATRPVSRTAT